MAESPGLWCKHCSQEFADQSRLHAHYKQHAAIQDRTGYQRIYGFSHDRTPQLGQSPIILQQISSSPNANSSVLVERLSSENQTEEENERNESNRRLASISNFMNQENELIMFRRFSELNIHNLLFMQTELVALENRLEMLTTATTSRTPTGSSSPGVTTHYNDDREVVMALITEKLDKYNKALLLLSQLRKLDAPEGRSLTTIHDWVADSNLMDYPECQFLRGKDIIALEPNIERGSWVYRAVEAMIWKFLARSSKYGRTTELDNGGVLYTYDNKVVARVVRLALTFLSSALLVVPIIILYFVKGGPNPLIVVTVCTVAVAVIIALTTDCKNYEILMAAAAYGAVMIVYVAQ